MISISCRIKSTIFASIIPLACLSLTIAYDPTLGKEDIQAEHLLHHEALLEFMNDVHLENEEEEKVRKRHWKDKFHDYEPMDMHALEEELKQEIKEHFIAEDEFVEDTHDDEDMYYHDEL